MKKVRLNTKFLAEEGIPEIMTVCIIPTTMLAYFCGWCHGGVETSLCAVVFLLCAWSAGYREWQEVKEKVSRLLFGVFCLSFLAVMVCGAKLYAMTDIRDVNRLLVLALVMLPSILIAHKYNNTIRKAEKFEKDREHRMAVQEYYPLWAVAAFLLAYSACFYAIYYFGDSLSEFFSLPRLSAWQAAIHNTLD